MRSRTGSPPAHRTVPVFIDPVFGYSVFISDVVPEKATRTFAVSSSVVTYHASNGLDKRNPRTTDKRNFSSRGRLSDSGVIRPDLVQAGIANGTGLGHVLQFWFVKTDADTLPPFCHPMIGAEKRHIAGFGAEGERMRINPGLNLAGRGLSGASLVIARTVQEHGAYR